MITICVLEEVRNQSAHLANVFYESLLVDVPPKLLVGWYWKNCTCYRGSQRSNDQHKKKKEKKKNEIDLYVGNGGKPNLSALHCGAKAWLWIKLFDTIMFCQRV